MARKKKKTKRRWIKRTEPLPNVALNVKRFRKLAKLTQKELDQVAGVNVTASLESGRRDSRYPTLDKIAKALSKRTGVTVKVEDLRGPPIPLPDKTPDPAVFEDTFNEFLKLAPDISLAEKKELRAKAQWPWGGPTVMGWYHQYQVMRETRAK